MSTPIIAVDGPAASGKGTLCHLLAEEFRFDLLDTGLLYRAVAAHCVAENLPLEDETQIARFVKSLRDIDTSDVARLRSEKMGGYASKVSRYAAVRERLLDYQHTFGCNPPSKVGAILDGRDIGTVIFPNTPYKIFLSASAEVRAQRRYKEMFPNGDGDYETILKDVRRRDHDDQNRTIAPLLPAQDALEIDSSNLYPHEVYHQVIKFLSAQGLSA